MSLADTQYLGIIENILDQGIYGQNRTGIANCLNKLCNLTCKRNFQF